MAQLGSTNIYGDLSVTGSINGTASSVSRATFGDGNNATHDANEMVSNGIWYYLSNGPSGLGETTSDGAIYTQAHSTSWVGQIAQDYRNGNIFVRGRNNGSWTAWKKVEANTATTAGSCSGNAATCSIDGSINIKAGHSNEINFGGTNDATELWFGYRAEDSRPVPTIYNFGPGRNAAINAGAITGSAVYNAVWNDLTDRIPVDDECELEYGKYYCFDGEHYYQSNQYCPSGMIGIHSDTGGFEMGHKEGVKELQCSVAGFVLAYVDREYPVGTALTPTCCGYLTEISKKDKMEYPERIVATYWKNEPNEYWGSDDRKVKVNGRKWVKIK